MYKLILATRYLIKRRITYFAVLAVALCVFIVVVVMTVMTGLVGGFKEKNHSFVGDCVVGTKSLVGFAYYEDFVKTLQKSDFVHSTSPVIKSFALVTTVEDEQHYVFEIMGFDPVQHSRTTNFGRTLHHRKANVSKAFEPTYDPNLAGFVIGIDRWLPRDAKGTYSHESEPSEAALLVSCIPLTTKGAPAKAGVGLANTKRFYYSDTSHSGLARVDGRLIYLEFEQAQQLCGMAGPTKRVNAIHIKFKPNIRLQAGCHKVSSLWQRFKQEKAGQPHADLLENVTVQSWKDYRRASIAPMEKEQAELTVMFGLVGITTVFIVLVVFYMIISHKSKDIGILKSVGVSNSNIILLFLGFASLVGLLGAGIGTFAGCFFLLKINHIESWLFEHFGFQLWDRTIYAIGDIPNQIDFEVVTVIIFSAMVACLAGALIPSWQAARLRPVETLQVSQL